MEKNPVSQRSGSMSVQLFKPKENDEDSHNTEFSFLSPQVLTP